VTYADVADDDVQFHTRWVLGAGDVLLLFIPGDFHLLPGWDQGVLPCGERIPVTEWWFSSPQPQQWLYFPAQHPAGDLQGGMAAQADVLSECLSAALQGASGFEEASPTLSGGNSLPTVCYFLAVCVGMMCGTGYLLSMQLPPLLILIPR